MPRRLLAILLVCAAASLAQTTPKEALGFNLGDDYHVANYTQLEAYWKKLASQSDRLKLEDIGMTAEGRHQYMAVITSPENQKRLDHYRDISRRLALAEGVSETEARTLAREGKAVIFMDGGLHATETVGSQGLMELVYQMVSRTDEETMRFLNDDILLLCLANPDGQELVANWYMREPDEKKRTLNGVPRLWQKYIGHDNARDMFMSNQPETANINRVLFIEWFPQITHTHHQTGPAGAVVFMPPFRDPFNYNFDPLMPVGVDLVGAAMHSRLIAKGMPGSAMRGASNYSTWWNGGMRTISYFHNMIGLLTEIIGNPTPIEVPLVLERQLPSGSEPMPIAPQVWHYRQSIEYEMEYSRAVMDVASRYRETFLYNIWQMGRNSIERGSRDNWTISPKRIAAAEAVAAKTPRRGSQAAAGGDSPGGGRGAAIVSSEIYKTVLHDPEFRDPRGYIIPAGQDDFPTAVKFINVLLKNGIAIHQATAPFQVAGKSYPAGSYVVKAAQAARPFVMDMFEPQDHPNDFKYPGGPPNPPYDITGWTLAFQMGVQFDRILDAFDGPFMKVSALQKPPVGPVVGPSAPAGYLISHRVNNSFTLVNRLLKGNCDVYWLETETSLGTGTIWVPASDATRTVLVRGGSELGVPVEAVAKAPAGTALKLKPVRIGLYDQYGGLIPSGWTRWLLEQFEFPYEVVYPQTLDAGDLKSRFDVLVFTDGAVSGGRGGGRGGGQVDPQTIPAEYRGWLGRITTEKTVPQLKKFAESGGSIVTIGSSTGLAELLGLPVKRDLIDKGQDQFYIPGSILRASIDNTNPLAYGMGKTAYVDFDSSPVFRLAPDAASKRTSSVARFTGAEPLASGWAWGQQLLDGATAIAEGSVGEGKVFVFGPEVAFRGQSHGTFKMLFNGLFYGSAQETVLKNETVLK
ncbi:MAG TPA: M14 family metallopeptidase [Bryobacteraceae bacterium]